MKFIGRKEMQFVNQITRELVQGVIGQEITYWQVLSEKTKTNDLYNEAINKTYALPVKTSALVMYENTTQVVTNFPADSKFKVEVYFHNDALKTANLAPKMGDFVQFGEIVYEIYTVTQPQIAFGMIQEKVMTKCTCGPARQGQVNLARQPMPQTGGNTLAPKYSEQPRDFTLKGERK